MFGLKGEDAPACLTSHSNTAKDSPKKKANYTITNNSKELKEKGNSLQNKEKALKQLHNLKDRLNQELLTLLEYEQEQENERDTKLKELSNEEERQRLDKIFGIERARASNRIMQVSQYGIDVGSMRR